MSNINAQKVELLTQKMKTICLPSLYVAVSLLHETQAADLPEECWQLLAASAG